jgi:6-phosphogluconolactonase
MKVLPNGLLEPVASIQHQGCGINKERQEAAHCHCAISTPTEKYMCVCDLGIDQIVFYPLTGNAADFNKVGHVDTKPGAGPRHLIFKGRIAYLINELDNTVVAYKANDIEFEQFATYSTLPEDFKEFSKCAAIKISPNYKWLLASNRGHNSIAAFKINQDGTLVRKVINKLGGEFPRDFSFYPDGSKVVVGHKTSDEFVTYDFDDETGVMAQTSECFKLTKPLAFVFD